MLASALVGVASAAPSDQNPNLESGELTCDEPIGVTVVRGPDNSATIFLPHGQVVVGLRGSGEASFTITTSDGTVFGPFLDSSEEGAKGKGFESRLVECSFTETFTETFILDAEAAAFFAIPEAYVGTEVTLEGTFDGTAWVIIPGNK